MIGVDLFFVLSGLLITTILRSEFHQSGTISLTSFYWRRMLRLCPALIVMLTAYAAVGSLMFSGADVVSDVVAAGLYLSDYTMAIWGSPLNINHTWSLAVEQHFYLVWPLLLLATRRLADEKLAIILMTLFVAATTWRMIDVYLWQDWYWSYYRFDTRLSGLVLGGLIAVLPWRPEAKTAEFMGKAALYILALAVVLLRIKTTSSLDWGVLVADLASACLLLSLASGHETSTSRVLSKPVLVYLGSISYSIYLWHYPIARWLRDDMNPFVTLMIVASISIALAALSYEFIEKPLSTLKRRKVAVA
ncbi:peptidoglycan/LPS O-acetylase OafA/YrhL [Rhizobium sp. BK251]|nr:peptidoglycan/LPS O-acetylase OafA/YrhL [Rhizobium sp. BK251]